MMKLNNSKLKFLLDKSKVNKQGVTKLFFSSILSIYVFSLPFKNVLFECASIFLILYFVSVLVSDFKGTVNYILSENNKYIFYGIVAIVITMTTSNILSGNHYLSWRAEIKFVLRYIFILYSLLLLCQRKYLDRELVVIVILCSITFVSLTGVYEYYILDRTGRISGFVGNPNPFGLFMALGVVLSISLLIQHKPLNLSRRLIGLLLMLMLLYMYNDILSGCRSTWILIVSFVSVSIVYIDNDLRKNLIFILLILFAGIMVFLLLNPDALANVVGRFSHGSPARIKLYQHVWQLILENPIVGYGMNYEMALSSYPVKFPHNSLLEILLTQGVLGLISWSMVLFAIFNRMKMQQNPFYMALFCSLFLVSLLDFRVTDSKRFLSILTILMFFIMSTPIKIDMKCKNKQMTD